MQGFGKKKCRENNVINMTSFDTPTIDTMLSRFPAVVEDIFKELDSKNIVKCRKVSVPWQNFIDNQKFIWIQRMQKYSSNMEQFYEQWKLAIRNTPTDHVKELSKLVEQFFQAGNFIPDRKSQWAPLHVSADQGHLELSIFFIQKTRDKNPKGFDDTTPLHMAAYSGYTEVCRHIVEIVDDKNPADKNGATPLSNAAFNGHLETYQLIADSLEDKNPYDSQGRSSLHLASKRGHIEVCKYIMDNLPDKNPGAIGGTSVGLTPYDFAALYGQVEICKLFLEILADKNPAGTFDGCTPLHQAAHTGHLEVCKLILESIQDINPVANDGVTTPLHCAARKGHLEILRLFLDNGADKSSVGNGLTPSLMAASHGHFRSCLFLMGNLQDIVSFFKGIWNHIVSFFQGIWNNIPPKEKLFLKILLGLFIVMVIMLVFLQIGKSPFILFK